MPFSSLLPHYSVSLFLPATHSLSYTPHISPPNTYPRPSLLLPLFPEAKNTTPFRRWTGCFRLICSELYIIWCREWKETRLGYRRLCKTRKKLGIAKTKGSGLHVRYLKRFQDKLIALHEVQEYWVGFLLLGDVVPFKTAHSNNNYTVLPTVSPFFYRCGLTSTKGNVFGVGFICSVWLNDFVCSMC